MFFFFFFFKISSHSSGWILNVCLLQTGPRSGHDRMELQIKVKCCFVMSNGDLFVGGSTHHSADRFSDVSRERQCAFMSLYQLCCAKGLSGMCHGAQQVQLMRWTEDYGWKETPCNWKQQQTVPDAETLPFHYLPVWACCPTTESNQSRQANKSNEMRIKAQTNNQSPTKMTNNQLTAVVVKRIFPFFLNYTYNAALLPSLQSLAFSIPSFLYLSKISFVFFKWAPSWHLSWFNLLSDTAS